MLAAETAAPPPTTYRKPQPRQVSFTFDLGPNGKPSNVRIKTSDNKPTYYVTPKMIGYIHWIVTNSITTSANCSVHIF